MSVESLFSCEIHVLCMYSSSELERTLCYPISQHSGNMFKRL